MKVIYIHGFQSSPKKEKVDILNRHFDEVFAPNIDWEDDDERMGLYKSLSAIIKRHKITHIVGSSMGGQMAFYLAINLNIRALCFNPAFDTRYFDFGFPDNKSFTNKIDIILGKNDDLVNPKDTISFLRAGGYNNSLIDIETLNIGHSINLKTFEYGLSKIL